MKCSVLKGKNCEVPKQYYISCIFSRKSFDLIKKKETNSALVTASKYAMLHNLYTIKKYLWL